MAGHRDFVSVLTPAFNEEENIPLLYERLKTVLGGMDVDWEWIVVDDHSADRTFPVINQIAREDKRVQGVRFAKNFGSHIAMSYALHRAQGDCAVVMAADLQDPPETLPQLLEKWRDGVQVVWAARGSRPGEKTSTVGFSRLYYWFMRNVVHLHQMPKTGADFFLIDKRVIDAVRQFKENTVSLLALITWMGFRQDTITYQKEARVHGSSGWNVQRKLKLVIDSITAFTYLPLRLMVYMGVGIGMAGFCYAAVVIANAILGNPTDGWSSLMVVILVMGGLQFLMMGILGAYVWRTLDESRRRPHFWLEAETRPDDEVRTQ